MRIVLDTTSVNVQTELDPTAPPPASPVLGAHPYRPRAGDLPVPSGPVLRRTLELTGALIERSPPAVLGPLSPDQAADELLGYLRRHGHLPAGGSANAAGP